MKLSLIAATIIGVISAAGAGWEYDYAKLGVDWPSIHAPEGSSNHCGDELNQSPINLMQPIGSYGWAYGETVPKTHDQLEMNYKDLKKKIKVEWATNTVKVALADTESDDNYFYTKLGKDKYGANAEKFYAQQFHFHHPSEHTVNGKYHDLEMHTVHLADTLNVTGASDIKYAAVGIFFSVENFDKKVTENENRTIDEFFDTLQFDLEGEPEVERIDYGKLMKIVEMDYRWIYKGSTTTPPCHRNVFWNVVRRVYPIKERHLKLFKNKLTEKKDDVGNTVNHRRLQKINDHEIHFVGAVHIGKTFAAIFAMALSVMVFQ